MKASHWDDIYNRKSDSEVSWFQENATKSMELISDLDLLLSDAIIDIGGGNSRLVD